MQFEHGAYVILLEVHISLRPHLEGRENCFAYYSHSQLTLSVYSIKITYNKCIALITNTLSLTLGKMDLNVSSLKLASWPYHKVIIWNITEQ